MLARHNLDFSPAFDTTDLDSQVKALSWISLLHILLIECFWFQWARCLVRSALIIQRRTRIWVKSSGTFIVQSPSLLNLVNWIWLNNFLQLNADKDGPSNYCSSEHYCQIRQQLGSLLSNLKPDMLNHGIICFSVFDI